MTVLIETYKDENTTTVYYGYILDNIIQISLSNTRESLRFFSDHFECAATVGTKLLKKLEICEDGK